MRLAVAPISYNSLVPRSRYEIVALCSLSSIGRYLGIFQSIVKSLFELFFTFSSDSVRFFLNCCKYATLRE